MRFVKIIIKITYVFLFFISSSFADEVVPVDIIADEMQWNDNNKIAYAIGNALATQGEKTISADKLIVYLENNKENNEITLSSFLINKGLLSEASLGITLYDKK